MKRVLVNVFVSAILFSAFGAQAADQEAKAYVDRVANQVLSVVKDDTVAQEDKQSRIEKIFIDKVDIDFVAKFVLGKHWREASPEQKKDYTAAYKPFILKNYAGKLAKYSGQTYELKSSHTEDDASIVPMIIHDTNGRDVSVDYRLRSLGSGFKIVDITVEGVSLLTTQRSEFNGIVERKGIDGLIAALKAQVAAK